MPRRYWAWMALIQSARSTNCMSPFAGLNPVSRASVARSSIAAKAIAVPLMRLLRAPGRASKTGTPRRGKKAMNVRTRIVGSL
jgi:hypothetical protein